MKNAMRRQAEKEYQLAMALRSSAGREQVAQTMFEPFKEGRDYVSIGRKLMFVHHVPQGAPMWYDKDPQFSAVKIAERGSAPIVEIFGRRVTVDPFPIAVLVRVPVLEVAVRRFDILDREQVRARAEMAEIEDTEVFTALTTGATATTSANSVVVGSIATNLTRANLADAYAQVEDNDVPVANVVMRALQYRAIRTFDGTDFDPVTRRELLKTGYMGDLWGAQLRISKKQTENEVLVLGDPEFLGVISVRIDLDQMEAPKPELLHYGWVFFEYIGIAQITDVGSALIRLV